MTSAEPSQSSQSYEWELPARETSFTAASEPWRSPLCDVCRTIFTGPLKWQQRDTVAQNTLNQTVEGLRDSIKICHLCHLRWDQLSDQDRIELADRSEITYYFFDGPTVVAGLVFEYKIQTRTVMREFKLVVEQGRKMQ
ncbi:MAG: hypothetical protein MMC33_003459 [Icmadophila ericetorum]|nr:hypothetical protein [Icmadophila ericetorum]